MQKASAGCVIPIRSFGGLVPYARLLSPFHPDSGLAVLVVVANRHEHRYFLFLLFFGLGGQFASG